MSAINETQTRVMTVTVPQGHYVLMVNVELTNLANGFLQDNRRMASCYITNEVLGTAMWPTIRSASMTLPAPDGRPSTTTLSLLVPVRVYQNTPISLACGSTVPGLGADDVQVFASGARMTAMKVESVNVSQ